MIGSGITVHRKNATMSPRSAAAASETRASGRSSCRMRTPVTSLPGVPPQAATGTVSNPATTNIPTIQLSAGRSGAMPDTTVVVTRNSTTSMAASMLLAPTRWPHSAAGPPPLAHIQPPASVHTHEARGLARRNGWRCHGR